MQFDALTSFWKRVAAADTLLIILDDVHCADLPSLRLLQFVAHALAGAPLLALVTYREVEARQESAVAELLIALGRAGRHLPLLGLSAAEVRRFAELAVGRPLPAAVTEGIHRETEGNPFFLEECVRTLVETKVLAGERGHYRLAMPLSSVQVPGRVQSLLAARIDRLSAQDKQLLQTAAVVGKDAPLVLLSAVSGLVIDCTVEGLLHAPELGAILGGGARVLMISNEHPDIFERLGWDADLPRRVDVAHQRLRTASEMRVTSDAGTDLTVNLTGAFTAGSTGLTAGPGSIAHWPGGLVIAFPAASTVNGTLVMAVGDLNLTFNRVVETPIELTITDDHVTQIAGDGVDAQLFRSYLSAFGDRASYATSHVGWGMNTAARWETVELYDRRETWGTEARAVAGNFLYSTGANEVAGRFTAGHFDLPMRHCTVALDGDVVVERGELIAELRDPQ